MRNCTSKACSRSSCFPSHLPVNSICFTTRLITCCRAFPNGISKWTSGNYIWREDTFKILVGPHIFKKREKVLHSRGMQLFRDICKKHKQRILQWEVEVVEKFNQAERVDWCFWDKFYMYHLCKPPLETT